MSGIMNAVNRVAKNRIIVSIIAIAVSIAVSAWWNYKEKEHYYEKAENLESKVDTLVRIVRDLQAENQKLKINQLLTSAIDNRLPYGQVLKARDRMILAVNNVYEDDYLKPNGYRKSDYVGGYDREFWGEDIDKEFKKAEERVIKTETPLSIRISVPNPFEKGKILEADVTVYPIKMQGTVIAVGVIIDKEYK